MINDSGEVQVSAIAPLSPPAGVSKSCTVPTDPGDSERDDGVKFIAREAGGVLDPDPPPVEMFVAVPVRVTVCAFEEAEVKTESVAR